MILRQKAKCFAAIPAGGQNGLRADLNISLDGFATATDQTTEKPMSPDWMRLVSAYVATKTVRERVFGDETGKGTTGIDDRYARDYFADVGAEIMGAGMFGLHNTDDANWKGWWGDEPPFRIPVLVLTHTPRPDITFANGTSFHFLDTSAEDALARARALAGERDIRIGGGASLVRDFLKAGLIDRLHVGIAPVILSQGVRLWDDLRHLEDSYSITSEVSEGGVIHVTFER
ncbi:dihydrofolate reductase family protein [Devosia sp. SD17-2]|uniref:dihydrofolate reductase family protein n=1 Tax=Devosia sp. SD17-2 TaxID=2976459 RepID=UPI0023D8BA8D|nr:dihydrofolate reductase family protein [Devosia sp. SD17-2]WEJ32093.1 dihydrofolate reductase family protein [Devosia sp. SD17-2]